DLAARDRWMAHRRGRRSVAGERGASRLEAAMTSASPTPAGAPRKTLEDIRREIEEEFAPPEITPSRVAVEVDDRDDGDFDAAALEAFRRPKQHRAGYIVAAFVGCVIGQLVLLGYFGVMYYSGRYGTLRIAETMSSIAETPFTAGTTRDAPVAPDVPPASNSGTDAPRQLTQPPTSNEVAAPTVSDPTVSALPAPLSLPPRSEPSVPPTSAPSVPPTRVPPGTSAPRATVRAPAANEPRPPVSGRARERPAVPDAQTETFASGKPRRPATGQDWVKAQDSVRAALGEWLAASGRLDDSLTTDIVVILGGDGQTARTVVPMRSGGGVVLREQRWERGPNGWRITTEREVSRER